MALRKGVDVRESPTPRLDSSSKGWITAVPPWVGTRRYGPAYTASLSAWKKRSSPTLGSGLGEQIWGWVLAFLCKIQTAKQYVEALS